MFKEEMKFKTSRELKINYDEKYNLDEFISAIKSRSKTDPDIFSETWEYNPDKYLDAENIRSRCYKAISPETCIYLSKGIKHPDNIDINNFGKIRNLN
jgi:hypothetical protein